MTESFLTEAEKAEFARIQLDASPDMKAELEFHINDYQDHVSQIMKNCENMGLHPGQAIAGYVRAVALCISSFTAQPYPGREERAAKTVGDLLTAHLTQLYKDHP